MQKDSQQEKPAEPIANTTSITIQSGSVASQTMLAEPPELAFPSSDASTTPIHDRSTLAECIQPYRQELMMRGKSTYTVTCFLSDLKMFSEHIGPATPVGRLSKENLTDWLLKLKFSGRGQTLAPKTMARRVTFLKNFFTWLLSEGAIFEDPSASLVLERPLPPLPELLSSEEIAALLRAAAEEVRCYCLVTLVLHGGLKKEEVMGLKLTDVDLTDPHKPLVTVRFAPSTNKQHRERRLAFTSDFTTAYNTYVEKYRPATTVFECTDRNLNYILARAVKSAGIEKRVTLQLLRDIFAVQQLREGASFDTLREKLGLSDEAWLESKEKYRRLLFQSQ